MKELGFVLLPGLGVFFFIVLFCFVCLLFFVGDTKVSAVDHQLKVSGCGEKGKAKRCYFNLAVQILGNPAEDQAVSAAGRAWARRERWMGLKESCSGKTPCS